MSLPEKSEVGQQRPTLSTAILRTMKINVTIIIVNFRSNKEQTTEEKLTRKQSAPITEVDLETPEQSTDEVERKTTEWTPMPNVEEQRTKTIEFSPIGSGNEITGNTPELIKHDSQTKRTSLNERFAAMVGMKPRDKEEATTDKNKTYRTVSATTTRLAKGRNRSQREQWVTQGDI